MLQNYWKIFFSIIYIILSFELYCLILLYINKMKEERFLSQLISKMNSESEFVLIKQNDNFVIKTKEFSCIITFVIKKKKVQLTIYKKV